MKWAQIGFFVEHRKKDRDVRSLTVQFRDWRWLSCQNLFFVNAHKLIEWHGRPARGSRTRCAGYNHVFLATQIIDTPNGKFIRRSHRLSAPRIRPSKPFSAPIVMLFSEAGRNPVRRISTRPTRMGTKKVMFA